MSLPALCVTCCRESWVISSCRPLIIRIPSSCSTCISCFSHFPRGCFACKGMGAWIWCTHSGSKWCTVPVWESWSMKYDRLNEVEGSHVAKKLKRVPCFKPRWKYLDVYVLFWADEAWFFALLRQIIIVLEVRQSPTSILPFSRNRLFLPLVLFRHSRCKNTHTRRHTIFWLRNYNQYRDGDKVVLKKAYFCHKSEHFFLL